MRKTTFLVILLAIFALSGCDKEKPEGGLSQADTSNYLESKIKNFDLLIAHYFGTQYKVVRYEHASSGLVKAVIQRLGTSNQREIYILPNERDIIEGSLYTPDMDLATIRSNTAHVSTSLATKNSIQQSTNDSIDQEIRNIMTNTNLTPDEVKQQVKAVFERATASTNATQEKHRQNQIKHMDRAYANHQSSIVEKVEQSKLLAPNPIDIEFFQFDDNSGLADTAAPQIDITKPVAEPQTQSVVKKYEPPKLPSNVFVPELELIYESLEKGGSWVQEGENDKTMYVFFDFQCPGCLELHKEISPFTDNNDVAVRYVPVGMLDSPKNGNQSSLKAAYTLAAPNNDSRKNVKNILLSRKPVQELFTAPPPEDALASGIKAINDNKQLHIKTGKFVTPLILYKDVNGNFLTDTLGGRSNYQHAFKTLISRISD